MKTWIYSLLKINLFLFIPIALCLYNSLNIAYSKYLVINLVIALFILLLAGTGPLFKKICLYVLAPILFILFYLEVGNLVFSGQMAAQSIYLSIFNSNFTESTEYIIDQLLNLKNIAGTTILLLAFYFLVFRTILSFKQLNYKKRWARFLCTLLVIICGNVLFKNGYHGPLRAIKFYKNYFKMQSTFDLEGKERFEKLDFKISKRSNNNNNHILIIGESLSRTHMSLYNYSRNTSPELSKRKDLLKFTKALSPHTQTLQSLQKVLSFASFKQPELLFKQPTLIELLQRANIEVTWISNQEPLDPFGLPMLFFSNLADNKIFTRKAYEAFDANIFPELDKIIESNKGNQLIIIHLEGSHARYKKKYPPEYKKFTNSDGISYKQDWHSEKMIKLINEYDNSVLYNDYIINEVLNKVSKSSSVSTVTYFSDHGEEVFEKSDYHGHHEDQASKYMYNIPFLVWVSPSYQTENTSMFKKLKRNLDTEFVTHNFIHFYQDLIGVYSSFYVEENNFINDTFKPEAHPFKDKLDLKN